MSLLFVQLSLLCCSSMIQSNHFYGGTLAWKFLDVLNVSSGMPIVFTQSYQWRQSQTLCDQSVIVNRTRQIPSGADLLRCVTSACGNYSSLSVNGYCTDFNWDLNSSSSQISQTEGITIESQFCLAYQGATWPRLLSPACAYSCHVNDSKGSIGTCVDLTVRPDGSINSSPVATIISRTCLATGANRGDHWHGSIVALCFSYSCADPVFNEHCHCYHRLWWRCSTVGTGSPRVSHCSYFSRFRCRWATNTSSLDECGEVCGPVPRSTLTNNPCTLTFNSSKKDVGNFYAVALTVEDFLNESSTTALSSVPVQFLVEIVDEPNCLSSTSIGSDAPELFRIPVGSLFQLTLFLDTQCPGVTISDVFRMSPLNMYKSDVIQNSTTNTTTMVESWIPTIDQIGFHMYCAVVVDRYSCDARTNDYWLDWFAVPQ